MLRICEHGVVAPLGVRPFAVQVLSARVCAMVSPALVNAIAGLVFGNGEPVVGAPGLTGLVKPARPCEVLLTVLWQPLQVFVSPGSSCSQLVCCAVMRLAFTSTMSMVKGTFAGTWTRTDPSGCMGAYPKISRMPMPAGPNAELLILRTVLPGISTAFWILMKR